MTIIKRMERAIKITAAVMVQHDLPQLLLTLKRLETELCRLRDKPELAYARRVLAASALPRVVQNVIRFRHTGRLEP